MKLNLSMPKPPCGGRFEEGDPTIVYRERYDANAENWGSVLMGNAPKDDGYAYYDAGSYGSPYKTVTPF